MSLALQLRKRKFSNLESLARKTSGWLTVKFLIRERKSVNRRVQPTSEIWYWVVCKEKLKNIPITLFHLCEQEHWELYPE